MSTFDDVLLEPEDRELRAAIRAVADAKIEPLAASLDETASFPHEAMALLADLGYLGMQVPARFGGSESTKLQYLLVVEELARACASTAATFMTQAHAAMPFRAGGTDDQCQRWLPAIADGSRIGCIALTEPDAGSDLGAIRTTAVRSGDEYVLSGHKTFITNGGEAGVILVLARTDGSGTAGLTWFIVDGAAPGVWRSAPFKKMGIRASNTVELGFDEVHVPLEDRLGAEGAGFGIAMATLNGARLSTAAQALGIAQAAFERAATYATQRQQFGAPIGDLQAIQLKLADMATQIASCRQLLYAVARLADTQPQARIAREAAMAKVACSDTAVSVATEALQVHGGYGYIVETGIERLLRDARITQIYDGTNEVNRLGIAREVLREIGRRDRG